MTADDLVKLRALLTRHEGRQPKLYLDTKGIPTLGVGRNVRDKGVTPDEIDLMLDNDIAEKSGALLHLFPWFAGLDVTRQAALIDMGFMGPEKLLGFSKMLAAIRIGDFGTAAAEAKDSQWSKDVGPTRTADVMRLLRDGAW